MKFLEFAFQSLPHFLGCLLIVIMAAVTTEFIVKSVTELIKARIRAKTIRMCGYPPPHCDAIDEEKKMPFYYYQRNKNVNMSTCGTCQKLMELRRKIRKVQKKLGIEQTPFVTSFKREEHVKNVCVKNHSPFNPTSAYAN